MTAAFIFFLCLVGGLNCEYVEDAHITVYQPERGDALNCFGDCGITASGLPVEYGVTAACGEGIPIGTRVFIDGLNWRQCTDRGSAITGYEVDVAMPLDGLLINDHRDVVFVYEQD